MSLAEQVARVRAGVTWSALEQVHVLRIRGAGARAATDRLCTSDLFVRDSQLRQTLLLDEHGAVFADAYVGRDDDAWLIIAEGPTRDALRAHVDDVVGTEAEVADLRETHAMLSINGPFAWELMAALEGEGVVAFRYLSLYHPRPNVTYIRAGKTGEFGYDLLVPRDEIDAASAAIQQAGRALDLTQVSPEALSHCAFENWFVEPRWFVEPQSGVRALTPLELGLMWRVSSSKDFIGANALRAHRATEPPRLTGLACDVALAQGSTLHHGDTPIGTVVRAAPSPGGEPGWIGAGLIDRAHAHSGIDAYVARGRDGSEVRVRTVSPPFVVNLSLLVEPQRHSYQRRHEIKLPR